MAIFEMEFKRNNYSKEEEALNIVSKILLE